MLSLAHIQAANADAGMRTDIWEDLDAAYLRARQLRSLLELPRHEHSRSQMRQCYGESLCVAFETS